MTTLRALLAAGHTPLPWKFELLFKYLYDDTGLGYIRPEDEDGKEIAHHGDTDRSRAENESNAALIVAAVNALPVLLNKIERLEEALKHTAYEPITDMDVYEQFRCKLCGNTWHHDDSHFDGCPLGAADGGA